MGSTDFGKFEAFCRDATLPVCNLLSQAPYSNNQTGPWGGCKLEGIPLSGGRQLGNLGSILLCGIAIAVAALLVLLSERKKAAVGRREMQLFLAGYIVLEICEIFTVGEFPLNPTVRIAFSGVHIGMVIATTWILMLNGVVGYQVIDDGTPISLGLMVLSGAVLLVGTGYIALDTGYNWTGTFESSWDVAGGNRNIALYVLYQLAPLVFLVAFFVLEAILVLRVLGEVRPMAYLTGAALLFAIGQVFNYTISPYICNGTAGKIDGALFETLFTLLSVIMVWIFWSSITEDDWPIATGPATGYP
ncbi:chitin synthase III catalytic subunit domain-containing protein [Apiospora sp. TS-2023a]